MFPRSRNPYDASELRIFCACSCSGVKPEGVHTLGIFVDSCGSDEAAAGWIVFVFTILWLYCGDDYAQCSYTAVSGSAESGKSDCPLGITESESNTTNSQSSSIADSFQIAHATGEEIELAKKDAATFELLALRTLFFAPPEVDAETEPDPEPEPVRLEALVGDGVLAESEREMEPDGNQDDTWSGCWQASGWGERGIWSGGARQGEAVQYFDEMTVTCF